MRTVGKQEKGQNLVEFALILPIFLLLVVGTAEFGRAWMMKNILTGAAREGARVAAVADDPTASDNTARVVATAVLFSAGITVPPATISCCDPIPPTPYNAVQVEVSYPYTPFSGFFPSLPPTLKGKATMRRERY